MIVTLYIIQRSNGRKFTFNALAFAMGNFWIHACAVFAALTGRRSSFKVTSKRGLEGDFLSLAIPSLVYFALFIAAGAVGVIRNGLTPSVANNLGGGSSTAPCSSPSSMRQPSMCPRTFVIRSVSIRLRSLSSRFLPPP